MTNLLISNWDKNLKVNVDKTIKKYLKKHKTQKTQKKIGNFKTQQKKLQNSNCEKNSNCERKKINNSNCDKTEKN